MARGDRNPHSKVPMFPPELMARWCQESTIHHHITADGRHVWKRAEYVAQQAVLWDREQRGAK